MEGEVNALTEKVETKEVKNGLFLWKIESKKSKNGHSSRSNGSPSSSQSGGGGEKGAENSSKGSSKEESKDIKLLVDGKIKADDQFKSLFENHFMEKTQKVHVFKDRLPKVIQIKKYITNDKIIVEEKGEDEKEESIKVVIENSDVPQFFLTSYHQKMECQSPQLHQRTLAPQYQTIPLSQKALNKIIFSPLMNNTITTQTFNEFTNSNSSFGRNNYNKNSYFNSSFSLSSPSSMADRSFSKGQQQKSSKVKDFYPEVKLQSQFINSQIKNQFSLNSMQIQKVKKEVFMLDQFNYSLEKQKPSGSVSRAGSPLPMFDRANQLKQAENNSSTTPVNSVKKILVFPTLQAPTNHLFPSLSPRSPLNSSTIQSNNGQSKQKQQQQSSRIMCSSPNRINRVQNELLPISQNEKYCDEMTQRSFLDASSSRSTICLNQTGPSFRRTNLPLLPERIPSSTPSNTTTFRELQMTENTSIPDKSTSRKDPQKQKICSGLYLEDAEKNSKNDDKLFKKKIESISKYQDDLGNYKIKQMLSDLLKTMPNTRFDFQTRITSQISLMCKDAQIIKYDSYKQFAVEAEVHLEYIKIKYLKKKLDIIAFDFIMANLNIPKVAKKTIYDSEILKGRLYRHLRIFFRDIRRFLLSTKDIYSNLQRMIADQAFELKLLPAVFHLLSKKFPRQIEKLNQEPIFQKLILLHEKKNKRKYSTEPEATIDEELAESELISDIESDAEEQNDLNPFGTQFQLMHSDVLQKIVNADKKKQRKLKKYFRRIEKGQDIDKDSDEEKEYYDNIKLYKQQKGEAISEEEENKEISLKRKKQSKQAKERKNKTKSREKKLRKRDSQGNFDEDKSEDNNNSDHSKHFTESDDSDSQKSNSDCGDPEEEILRIEALNQIYSTPKYVFLLSSFLEAQERICKLESQNPIWKLLVQSLGHIHTLYRDSVKRIEVFIDFGLKREDLNKMAKRLNIDARREGDLMWIAYLYCGILLRFSEKRDRSILDQFLQMKEYTDYDSYFLEIVELNRVKRQFIVFEMSEKNQFEYTSLSQWFKLYDPETGEIFFYNPILKESRNEIEKKFVLLQEQYRAIEKYKFIELIDYIMKKLQDEDQKDQAMQFDIIFKHPHQTNGNHYRGTKQSLQRSILQLRESNSLRGSLLSQLQTNSNIPNNLKIFKKQAY